MLINPFFFLLLFTFDYLARKGRALLILLFHLFEFVLLVVIASFVVLYIGDEMEREEKKKKKKKERNTRRKMNVEASKPSFVLLCSIQHSNYVSSYVEQCCLTGFSG
jgi:uncharacterized membrane protein YbhN (UPF0104 family)